MAALLLTVLAACAHAPPAARPDTWDYRVQYADGTLEIEATLPAVTDALVVEADADAHIDELSATLTDGTSVTPTPSEDGWTVAGCGAQGCRLRYTYDLREATRTGAHGISGIFDARASELALSASPARWLLRPTRIPARARYRFQVHTPAGIRFVSGVTRAAGDAPDTYEAPARDLWTAPYSVFGALDVHTYAVPGGVVELAYPARVFVHGDEAVLRWAEGAVAGLVQYFGQLPVRRAAIILLPNGARGVYFGAARGHGGAAVQVLLGRATDRERFADDWVLVHELVHLGLPNLPGAQRWMEEGLATYLETIIRRRLGLRTEQQLWDELTRNLPQGLLADGDAGYNRSRSWAHTYWGGALFWFLADVRIRERTAGARSLADALRAVHAAGGTIEMRWRPERLIALGDRATGVPVLAELWASLGEGRGPAVALEPVLRSLGVTRSARGTVSLDEAAPQAGLRRALTAPFEGPSPIIPAAAGTERPLPLEADEPPATPEDDDETETDAETEDAPPLH